MLGLTPRDECTIGRVLLGVGGSGAALSLFETFIGMQYFQSAIIGFSLLSAVGGMIIHEYCAPAAPVPPPSP